MAATPFARGLWSVRRAGARVSRSLCYASRMRKLASISVAFAIVVTLSASAQSKPADSVERRLAAQNAIFEEFWQTSLKLNPTQATAVGDYRYNDKLGDNSLADGFGVRSPWPRSPRR